MLNNRYDEIKSLLKKSRMLMEQSDEQTPNIAKDIEDKIDQDNQEYETAEMEPGDDKEDDDTPTSGRDRVQKYRISGGILALHGKGKTDTDITTDDKTSFQETMDGVFTQGRRRERLLLEILSDSPLMAPL